MKLLDPSEYQPLAGAVFTSIAQALAQLIPTARVEHVGASAIPGAISKGDLDVCVIVTALDHANTVNILGDSGYVIKADTLRTPELCMLLSPRKDIELALQVIAEGSRFEFFLQFRDALRNDPQLVEQYNELKRSFAPKGEEAYRDGKEKFIQAVLN